jgi:hypothetical protein
VERLAGGHARSGLSRARGKQTTDEGRHDPEHPRYRCATGTKSAPGARH